MDRLIAAIRDDLADGVNARSLGDEVINIFPGSREVTQDDVEVVNIVLRDAGWFVADRWIATEGMSWLSDGINSLSLRVRPL